MLVIGFGQRVNKVKSNRVQLVVIEVRHRLGSHRPRRLNHVARLRPHRLDNGTLLVVELVQIKTMFDITIQVTDARQNLVQERGNLILALHAIKQLNVTVENLVNFLLKLVTVNLGYEKLTIVYSDHVGAGGVSIIITVDENVTITRLVNVVVGIELVNQAFRGGVHDIVVASGLNGDRVGARNVALVKVILPNQVNHHLRWHVARGFTYDGF